MFKESSNPVFRKVEQGVTDTNAASFMGITIKTSLLFLAALLSAVGANMLLKAGNTDAIITFIIASFFISLVSVLIASFVPSVAPIFSILYAVAEGFTLGTLTILLDIIYPGIGITAVLATLVIFGVTLALYRFKIVRASNRLKKVVYTTLIGILVFSLLSFLLSFIPGYNIFISNPVVILIVSVLLLVFGATMLIIDFDRAESIVNSGTDKKYEWIVSLGLMVTIVWIYVQVLRILIIIFARRD